MFRDLLTRLAQKHSKYFLSAEIGSRSYPNRQQKKRKRRFRQQAPKRALRCAGFNTMTGENGQALKPRLATCLMIIGSSERELRQNWQRFLPKLARIKLAGLTAGIKPSGIKPVTVNSGGRFWPSSFFCCQFWPSSRVCCRDD